MCVAAPCCIVFGFVAKWWICRGLWSTPTAAFGCTAHSRLSIPPIFYAPEHATHAINPAGCCNSCSSEISSGPIDFDDNNRPKGESLINVDVTCDRWEKEGGGAGGANVSSFASSPCSEGSLCLDGDLGVLCPCYVRESTLEQVGLTSSPSFLSSQQLRRHTSRSEALENGHLLHPDDERHVIPNG